MSRQTRKLDHIKYSLQQSYDKDIVFKDFRVIPQPLPELNFSETDCSLQLWGKKLAMPLLINAMTGGHPETFAINKQLAAIAADTGVAIAVGSQQAALVDSSLSYTYKIVRQINPNGLVLANISAAADWKDVGKAVEMLQADAVQLFLNSAQEIFMEEGERDFRGIADNIADICRHIDLPVIVKEVGFGLTTEAIAMLQPAGVSGFDLSGKGGTDFLQIESLRTAERNGKKSSLQLDDWGINTDIALLEAVDKNPDLFYIAAGGIRSPQTMFKALVTGAGLVGVSGYFLKLLLERSAAALTEEINDWNIDLRKLMLLSGAADIDQLHHCPFVVTGRSLQWLEQRGVVLSRYAQRN